MKLTPLQAAIGADHQLARKLLSRYREAWLDGDYPLAQVRFGRFRRAVMRHFTWEESALVKPLRCGISLVHQHQVVQRDTDRHRLVRLGLDRIRALLPRRKPSVPGLELKILELVAELEELLDLHRTVFQCQLLAELAGLLTPDSGERLAAALSRTAHARSN